MTDACGFVRIGRWKIYIEEALPRIQIQLSFWEVRLRAEYQSHILAEYRCKWGKKSARPAAISQPVHHDYPFYCSPLSAPRQIHSGVSPNICIIFQIFVFGTI
jgi:hypothetical protein